MGITFETLASRILRKLDDANQTQYEEELVYDAVVAAHNAILPWVPKQQVSVLTSGSAGQTEFALPSNCYQIQALQELTYYKFIPRATLSPQTVRNPNYSLSNDWIDYPSGYLSLSSALDVGSQMRLFYLATWITPTSETDIDYELEVPVYSYSGIIYYASAYCLKAKGSNTSNIRQWMQRTIDAGNPEDNPLRRQADAFYQDFLNEMRMMPPYNKVNQ